MIQYNQKEGKPPIKKDQSRAAKLRKEVDKSIQSQASVGGIATFIPRPARLVERYLVQMLTDDGFTVETTNDNNLRIAW